MKRIIAACASLLTLFAVGFPATAQASPGDPVDECIVSGLERSEVWISDYEADGRVQPKVPAGVAVPVLVVHGWTGNSAHIGDPVGNFSKKADLGAIGAPVTPSSRTVVGMLQYLNGTDVHTFDYSEIAGDWVTNERIYGSLAESIACLADRSGQDVIVIAHSMGGLALRQALGSAPGLVDKVSRVITFGTPNTGSDLALGAAAGISTATKLPGQVGALLVRQALKSCGEISTVRIATGTPCDFLPAPARAFDSAAGKALRTGSAELQELPDWPSGLTVHALAGDTTFTIARGGFLGLSIATEDVSFGDVIVSKESATAGSTTQDFAKCRYTISLVHGIGESLLEGMNLISHDEAGRDLLEGESSPCYHGALMRTQSLVNAMQSYVSEDLLSRWTIEPGRIGPWPAGATLEEAAALYGESVGTMPGPTEFACESVPAREYSDGSAVEFVWRAWNGEYASLLSLKNRPGQRTEVETLRTSRGIGLSSTQQELEAVYGSDLLSDGRTYGPNQVSSKYSTNMGNIHFYSTDGVVTGISVSAPGGQSLDHFCT